MNFSFSSHPLPASHQPVPPTVRAALRHLRISPRKALGQHFLTDRGTLRAILDAAEVSTEDLAVEVGPGLGVLTRALAERAGRVVAVEMDAELAEALRADLPPTVRVVAGDAREADVCALVDGLTGYKLLGNLPYYAASPILRRFLESPCRPSLAVIMVQKEVALQMTAQPGDMSLLSVSVQLYGHPRIVRTVRPGAFYPRPKVTSAVVRIDVYPEPALGLEDVDAFFQVVRAGFSAPRKQLRNALSHGLAIGAQEASSHLTQAGIDPQRRAETVSLEEWSRLYRLIRDGSEWKSA